MNNNNESKRWKTQVDVFRGFVKATLEDLDHRLDRHETESEERNRQRTKDKKDILKEIQKLKEYVAGVKAVSKYKTALIGTIGGIFGGGGVVFLLKMIF